MVDNFKKFKELFFSVLDMNNTGKVKDYFIKGIIIKRKKDNPDEKRDVFISTYYFTSSSQFEDRMEEIKTICDALNARFYVNPTIKSFKNVAFDMSEKVPVKIRHGSFSGMKTLFDSTVDENTGAFRTWILDLDTTPVINLDDINDMIARFKEANADIYLGEVSTVTGKHVFVRPHNYLDKKTFEFFTKIDMREELGYYVEVNCVELKKNHSTVVYANIK